MSIANGIVLNLILLLLSSGPLFSQKYLVSGSAVPERPDPLRQFKSYSGGYDLTNKHYWASAAFTGIHGYAVAGVWMICGLAFGGYAILKNLTGASSAVGQHSDSSYVTMFFLILMFSLLAIVATGLVIAANQSCLQRTRKLKATVLGAGDTARRTIRKVTAAMDQMQKLLLPYDPKTADLLNSTHLRLGHEWRMIGKFTGKNGRIMNASIQISYIANLAVVTVNMAFLVAAIVLLLLHWHPGFVIIIFFCWTFTVLCWVLTGFDFFFHTFADDTCLALEDFEQNPQYSSLSSVLPCTNSSHADKVLVGIGRPVHNSIREMNSKLTEYAGVVLRIDELNENSIVCNPFSGEPNYRYMPEKCSKGAIQIGDLPRFLSKFTCYQENAGSCESEGRFISEASYTMIWAYSNAIQDLINIFPDLQSLIHCSFVKEAFSNMVLHQCRPFRASTRRLWYCMLSLSIVMVVWVLLWAAKAYQDRQRAFSLCSIIPIPNT
ncbi:uncharacterized protein LOC127804290 [Diospyros lotus]|uniref:uncharacterized protein LOC127804290 n=1 Tax=Diospyros lotus TaxID=55363 RepID=UPI0022538188|nr:uncharacterized protein LOC127804290 [Diospyros lotus]